MEGCSPASIRQIVAIDRSALIASAVCVEALADLGMHLTLHQYAARYSGRPVADAWRQVEADLGRPLPDGFRESVDTRVLDRFASGPVEISRDELARHDHVAARRFKTAMRIAALVDRPIDQDLRPACAISRCPSSCAQSSDFSAL